MRERELAKRARSGDHDAFVELAEPYQDQIYRLAYRYSGNFADAEDLCQECFLRAWERLRRFDVDRPFLPWLMKVSANVCLNATRGRKRRKSRETEFEDGFGSELRHADPNPSPESEAMAGFERVQVLQALENVPDELRILVVMRFVNGLTLREIAEATDSKLSTVAFRIAKALDIMRDRLRTQGVTP